MSDKPIKSEEAVELEVRLKTEKKDVIGDRFAGNELEDKHHKDNKNEDILVTDHKPDVEDQENIDREEESSEIEIDDDLFRQFEYLIGDSVLVVTETQQLNLLGQTFRPIFCGTVCEVETGHITLYPVTIKLLNAPFHQSPFPLSIPFEKIAHFTPNFDCNMRFPLV
ncbi:hypothetical protein [Mesobacillus maritimus]|uniref:hypothetical protein n=1 Tax=Mesobacillus maritimus TaxID=1643336 RepID=UPI0031BBAECE